MKGKRVNIMSNIYQIFDKIFIDGKEIKQCKSIFFRNTICQADNKLYINGKEFKDGKWKYTIKSIINTIF